jgi:hypothetical protein
MEEELADRYLLMVSKQISYIIYALVDLFSTVQPVRSADVKNKILVKIKSAQLYYTSFVGVRSRYVFPPVWVFNMTS